MRKTKPAPYYPVFLNLRGKKCVVVGGGQVALRKVKMLLECEACVTVVSPMLHPELEKLAQQGGLQISSRPYQEEDCREAAVVVAATDDGETNRKIAADAKRRGAWVNAVDDPEHSDFIVPSYFRRGGLTLAVSTSGMSPALARKIRTRLEKRFGEDYGRLVSLVEEVRLKLKEKGKTVDSETWQEVLDVDGLLGLIRTGQMEKAKTDLLDKLSTSMVPLWKSTEEK